MARPKKQLPPAKDHQLTIRFTKELYNVLTADAEAAGLPRTEYILLDHQSQAGDQAGNRIQRSGNTITYNKLRKFN